MSDWGATHSGWQAIEAGEDMDMPGTLNFEDGGPSFFGANITRSINNGSLSMDRLDDMCRRIMTPYFQLHQTNYPMIDASEPDLNGNSRKYYASPSCLQGWRHCTVCRVSPSRCSLREGGPILSLACVPHSEVEFHTDGWQPPTTTIRSTSGKYQISMSETIMQPAYVSLAPRGSCFSRTQTTHCR